MRDGEDAIVGSQLESQLWTCSKPSHQPGMLSTLKMGYGEACQARRRGGGTAALDRNVSHTALHPLSRPLLARVSARAPPLVHSPQIQEETSEVKGILSAREKKNKKTAESSLRLRQIAGKGIVGSRSRRWGQRGSDRWWVGWGGCVCRWMPGPGAGCRGMFVSVLGTSIYLCLEQSQLCCLDTPSSSSILRFQPPPNI